jgi:ribosomal protein S18 acetylase RimI-like enzyme
MPTLITEEPGPPSRRYTAIPISFEVSQAFDVTRGMEGQLMLADAPRIVSPSYTKDYDATPGQNPRDWARWYDTTNWAFLLSWVDDRAVGGATIAWRTPGLNMLQGREDLAVLWDLRVDPSFRRNGVGNGLFAACEDWARKRGAKELLVETQNTNVPACRFYNSQGCRLATIELGVYLEFPEEARLHWLKAL